MYKCYYCTREVKLLFEYCQDNGSVIVSHYKCLFCQARLCEVDSKNMVALDWTNAEGKGRHVEYREV